MNGTHSIPIKHNIPIKHTKYTNETHIIYNTHILYYDKYTDPHIYIHTHDTHPNPFNIISNNHQYIHKTSIKICDQSKHKELIELAWNILFYIF